MADFLVESGKRGSRPGLVNQLYYRSEQDRQANVSKMHALCDEIIAERKSNPKPDARDLLNTMLYTDDPETGERLSSENIRHNLVTFLVRSTLVIYLGTHLILIHTDYPDCWARNN